MKFKDKIHSIPIISLVGPSGSGKTTLLTALIPELTKRGLRVGTIKHDAHGAEVDQPGKDTWRHFQAGAEVVALAGPHKLTVFRRWAPERSLEEVAAHLEGVDLILVEGFKAGPQPKIEVRRRGVGEQGLALAGDPTLVAVVTDEEGKGGPVPQLPLNDPGAVADFLLGWLDRQR
ncbi:MAG: molybdopterin-guanine dinucleotide biosynthesis protein B [Bacillota bacterium]|nr:molybdopterin-guanine dinucleotide biosynthesis protein B [Bacillota bacterium]